MYFWKNKEMATAKDYGLGPFIFPRGWFMVATSAQIGQKPHCVRFFGRDMVIYRGESGKAYMVGAYCPHMRTHIGKSTTSFMTQRGEQIEGESIHCPYHAWRFGPDGKCNKIPYSETIPPAAELGAYPVVEKYGALFYWNDPEGGAPDYDLPEIPEWDDAHYVQWEIDELGSMNLHQIEVTDNICDTQHLGPIHATTKQFYFENIIRGHRVTQLLGGKHEILGADVAMSEFITYYTGPGILLSRFIGDNANDSIMFIAHTPVDDGSVQVWHAVLCKIADRKPTPQDIVQARALQKLSLDAFAQDFEIWSNKEPCLKVMQMPADGNFLKVRTWYKQFYVPRADVAGVLARCEGRYTIPGMAGAEEGHARQRALEAIEA